MLLKKNTHGYRCSSRRAVAVVANVSPMPMGGAREPARPVALPSGTLWLLDAMQDQYYNVRGAAFVIPRVEEREVSQDSTYTHRVKFVRPKSLPARQTRPASGPSSLSLIHQAVAQEPHALMMFSDGPLIDVEVEDAEAAEAQAAQPTEQPVVPSGTTCTGIVPVPSSSSTEEVEEEDLYQTSSTSPRRTKMMRGSV